MNDVRRGDRIPRRVRSRLDAEDLKQDAWLRAKSAWMNREEFDPCRPDPPPAYFAAALRSAWRDGIRRHDRGKRAAARTWVSIAADLGALESLAADHTTPSGRAMRLESYAKLFEAMGLLPEDQRLAVTLHHLEGRSLGETAEIMRRTYASVAGSLRRGLKALRAELSVGAGS